MIIEPTKIRDIWAYVFSNREKDIIVRTIKPEIKKIEKKIERIRDNPKNEGQVKYQVEIECLRGDIKSIEDIIQDFELPF